MAEPPAVVILAGGEGRRMGGNKPLRPFGGTTLIERALTAAAGWSDEVAVCVRTRGQVGVVPVPEIIDDAAIEGPLGGLASALRYARSVGRSAVLTIPCDAPFLPLDLASRLQSGLEDHLCAAIASSGGALHPVCALWRTDILDALPAYVETGDTSLRRFAMRMGFAEVEWPSDPFDAFINVNTPSQLAAAAALLKKYLPGSAPGHRHRPG